MLLAFKPGVLSDGQVAQIRAVAPKMRVLLAHERAEIEAVLDEIDIIAGGFPRDLLAKAPRLRWFQQWGAGADWLMRYPEAAGADFVLTNVSGIHAVPISEHILAFLLAFARQLPQAVRAQERRAWTQHDAFEVFELAGKTMLLVGVGEVGARTAHLASALGIRILGVRRDPAKAVPGIELMYGLDALPQLLPQADVVVLTVPLTRETQGLMGEGELRAMKPSAYLINIGRGGTVRESDLIQALQERWIAGAGLDVFADEPLPEDSPLWVMSNVIITPHYSGSTPVYNERALAIFLENLHRYALGDSLRNVVDKARGY